MIITTVVLKKFNNKFIKFHCIIFVIDRHSIFFLFVSSPTWGHSPTTVMINSSNHPQKSVSIALIMLKILKYRGAIKNQGGFISLNIAVVSLKLIFITLVVKKEKLKRNYFFE